MLASKSPLGIDEVQTYTIKDESGKSEIKKVGWDNDHEFVVTLPAWVFRLARELS